MVSAQKFIKLKNNAFTLVELLVVITIVGILSSITISLIDPKKYQDRARDVAIVSTLNKISMATTGYLISFGSAPPPSTFITGLSNIKSNSCVDPIANGTYTCLFEFPANALPSICNSVKKYSGVPPTDASTCLYYYWSKFPYSSYRIAAKLYSNKSYIYVLDSSLNVIKKCPDSVSFIIDTVKLDDCIFADD